MSNPTSKRIVILFASENKNKYEEIKKYIDTIPNVVIELVKTSKEIYEIQSMNRSEIIMEKWCDTYADLIQSNELKLYDNQLEEHWLMVEDTSFSITDMGGFPGPFVKYYLNSVSLQNIAIQYEGSEAESIVSIGVYKISGSDLTPVGSPIVFEGIIEGKIADDVYGTNGFGYDPIFIPRLLNGDNENMRTYAQWSMEEKNKCNARILAVEKFVKYLGL